MPVLLITDSTLAKVLSPDTSLVHFGDNTVIHNSGASLSFAPADAAFPATLMSLLLLHMATLLKKYGNMQLDTVAVQASGSVRPSATDEKKYDDLARHRQVVGLKEFAWQFADVDLLMKKKTSEE